MLVGDIRRVKLDRSIRALCVPGLNADVLPRQYEEDALLSDEEKEKLTDFYKENGLAYFTLTDAVYARRAEEIAVYTAMTQPTEELFLTYSLADMEGTPLRRSEIADRLTEMFPSLEQGILPEDSPLLFEGSREELYAHSVIAARRAGQGEPVRPEWLGIYRYFEEAGEDFPWKDTLSRGFGDLSPVLNGRVMELFGTGAVSVSRLEEYAGCPFRYFVDYGMRPVRIEERALDAVDLGSLFHAALEKFSELCARQTEELTPAVCDRLAEEVSGPLMKDLFESLPEGARIQIERRAWRPPSACSGWRWPSAWGTTASRRSILRTMTDTP